MHRFILVTSTVTLTLASACSSVPEADDEAGVTTSPSSTDPTNADFDSSSDGDESSTTGDEDPTVSTSSSSSNDNDSAMFVDSFDDDGLWHPETCDAFAQDCPEGEKCVPYASNGGTWDDLKCVPIQGEQAVGEPCMYTGARDGNDDCDGTSWCWNVDENGNGSCHAFCTGTPDMPECPAMSQCTISGSGVINICLPTCDPIIQGCDDGLACFWDGNDFTCIATTQDIPIGDPCGFINDCALGNLCVDAAAVPDCNGSACCTNFCELGLGDAQCAGLPGTVCVTFFEEGMAPLGFEHVGICALPP